MLRSMSGEGKRIADATPRLSSTLPGACQRKAAVGFRQPGWRRCANSGNFRTCLSQLVWESTSPRKSITVRVVRIAEHGSDMMPSGTVKWFNAQKGYGFIQPDDGSKDIFVHISAVEQAGLSGLNDGQKISYDVEQGRQGKTSAVNLQVS